MFKKDGYKKRGFGIFGIFRMFLSLIVFTVLLIGLYQAYKSFSGVDPLTVSPKSIVKSLLNSESLYKTVHELLTFNPKTSLDKAKQLINSESKSNISGGNLDNSPLAFKFAVLADSHKDNGSLKKALFQIKQNDAKFFIGLGDFSDVGTIDELRLTKNQFDAAGLPYYVTAGDHDLWDARNRNLPAEQNFNQVFGSLYSAFSYQNIRFILIYDTDNYFGIDSLQLKWIEDELIRVKNENNKLNFVFSGTPLYHPSSDHVMGRLNVKLKNQADHLRAIFAKAQIAEAFAGDTHFFSRYKDPENDLKMTSVGAVTSDRNPQAPRFVMVDVYQNGSYNIEDIEIK